MINYTASYTDQYQLTMAQVYFKRGRGGEAAVFDYFFRDLPFDGGYAIFAGLETLLNILTELRFDREDIEFLHAEGLAPEFLEYLEDFSFTGNIYSTRAGDLIFPGRPVLQVEAPLIEAQIIETVLLNVLNFQTLIATKASRMRSVAGDRKLIDFGLRRAQGPAAYPASRAAFIGGFDATSNVRAGRDFSIPVSGTMAHSFVQSYDHELTAFRDFAAERAADCVLLVDTYDTLKSGLPNAITVAEELRSRGEQLKGIRLDSGDLAYLARASRQMLDAAGFPDVKIAVSNQLDEFVIRSLNHQQAPIDVFGVGTKLLTGNPDAALDGVYKLSYASGRPRIKLSESLEKLTLPHRKQVFRVLDKAGNFAGADAVTLREEQEVEKIYHPFDPTRELALGECQTEKLLQPVMEAGRRTGEPRSVSSIRDYSRSRLDKLPAEYKRFDNPHLYKVGLSKRLKTERDRLIAKYKEAKDASIVDH